tara:strand:+ start:93 stop:254 length:162 start_codon:yes stop_codon:yes gene_type:complete
MINTRLLSFCFPLICHHARLKKNIARKEQTNPVNLKERNPHDIDINEKIILVK